VISVADQAFARFGHDRVDRTRRDAPPRSQMNSDDTHERPA
jgi:hypothetical protein